MTQFVCIFYLMPFSCSSGSVSQFSSEAYVWGAGDGGQLGTGTHKCSLLPIQFPVPNEVRYRQFICLVVCCYYFSKIHLYLNIKIIYFIIN